eukprot:gene9407-3307_t
MGVQEANSGGWPELGPDPWAPQSPQPLILFERVPYDGAPAARDEPDAYPVRVEYHFPSKGLAERAADSLRQGRWGQPPFDFCDFHRVGEGWQPRCWTQQGAEKLNREMRMHRLAHLQWDPDDDDEGYGAVIYPIETAPGEVPPTQQLEDPLRLRTAATPQDLALAIRRLVPPVGMVNLQEKLEGSGRYVAMCATPEQAWELTRDLRGNQYPHLRHAPGAAAAAPAGAGLAGRARGATRAAAYMPAIFFFLMAGSPPPSEMASIDARNNGTYAPTPVPHEDGGQHGAWTNFPTATSAARDGTREPPRGDNQTGGPEVEQDWATGGRPMEERLWAEKICHLALYGHVKGAGKMRWGVKKLASGNFVALPTVLLAATTFLSLLPVGRHGTTLTALATLGTLAACLSDSNGQPEHGKGRGGGPGARRANSRSGMAWWRRELEEMAKRGLPRTTEGVCHRIQRLDNLNGRCNIPQKVREWAALEAAEHRRWLLSWGRRELRR